RLGPDQLASLGVVRKLFGAHAGAVEPVHQAELAQLARGMRQDVDADAERFDLADRLEHPARHADLVEAEREHQPANATPGDEYRHRPLDRDAVQHSSEATAGCQSIVTMGGD